MYARRLAGQLLFALIVVGTGGTAVVAQTQTGIEPSSTSSPTQNGSIAAERVVLPSEAAISPTPPPLDVPTLEKRLRETKAIGVFTKLTLKNQVDDLLDQIRAMHERKSTATIAQLREAYDLLIMKVLSLLQDSDPPLAKNIVASREPLWAMLIDPVKFSTIT